MESFFVSSYMFPGLYDTFPGTPDTFPGHIGPFPGLLLMEILIFNHRSGGKISIFPSKEVKEMDQYALETSQECQEMCHRVQETYN